MISQSSVIYEGAWGAISSAAVTYRRLCSLVSAGRVPRLARRRLTSADTAMQRAAAHVRRTGTRADHEDRTEIAGRMKAATHSRRALAEAAQRLAARTRSGRDLPSLEAVLHEYAGVRSRASPPSAMTLVVRVLLYLDIALGCLSLLASLHGWGLAVMFVQFLLLPCVVLLATLRLLADKGEARLTEALVLVLAWAGSLLFAAANLPR
jgi:hypothetical protein